MNSSLTKLIILLAVVLALLGGAAAGMLGARLSGTRGTASGQRLPLSDELQLNSAQKAQIRDIWETVKDACSAVHGEAVKLDQRREEALLGLLNSEQRQRYQVIHQDYQDQYTALLSRREKLMQQAISRTRQLLSDSQRRKYDRIVEDRLKIDGSSKTLLPASPLLDRAAQP